MLKKLIFGSFIAVGAGLLFLGPTSYSYIKTGYHSVRDTIKEQIPIDVEIKRARDLIENLKPEIASNLRLIAREEVEVAKLQKELDRKTESLDKAKVAIFKLKEDLQSGIQRVSYGGKSYSMDQVKSDLASRFKQFQTQEATHAKLEGILSAREKNLAAAREKLDAILAAKRQHEVTVENLQARYTMQQVAEATTSYSLNDSALNSVRETLEEISTRLDVAEKLVEIDVIETGIPVLMDEVESEDILAQVTTYFGAEPAESKLAESKLANSAADSISVVSVKPASAVTATVTSTATATGTSAPEDEDND